MSKLTDKFKNVAIAVQNKQESFDVQRALFALGYRNYYSKRELANSNYTDAHYVVTNHICKVLYGLSQRYEDQGYGGDLVTKAELFAAVEEHKQAKRDAKKASRKRKQLRKQGWIINTGVKPVRELTELLFRDGEVRKKSGSCSLDSNFSIPYCFAPEKTVVAYKLKPEKISIEELHVKVAKDIGKVPVKLELVPIEGEWIEWNGGECPVPKGTKIDVKYRDGKVAINQFIQEGNYPIPAARFWVKDNHGSDIIAYRIVKENKPAVDLTRVQGENPAPVGDVNSDARGSGARFNSNKPDFSLIPLTTLEGEARVWAFGAAKYKAWNWMKGMDWSVPYACAMRHMAAWQRGEENDPESGESHLDHAMCNLRMLKYYATHYKEGDNRPKAFFTADNELE